MLSQEELELLEEDLKAFLIVNGIHADEWEQMNTAAPEKAIELISAYKDIEDTGEAFAAFDYQLNKELVVASGNPIYLLILNGFKGL